MNKNRKVLNKAFSDNHWLYFIIVTITLLALLLIHVDYYLPFISDDAFISLRYAKRLIDGYGLTWTDGIPVEGYSNLLWVLLSAFIGLLGFDLVLSLRILGIICSILTIAAITYYYKKGTFRASLPALVGGSILVLSSPFAVWTIGGLEQPLLIGLLSWAIVLIIPILQNNDQKITIRMLQIPGLLLGLLCITRPDSLIFIAAIMISILVIKGFSKNTFRIIFGLLIFPSLFFIGQLIFRLAYYGEWVPNTALVKFSPSRAHLKDGLFYLHLGFKSLLPHSILAIISAFVCLIVKTKRPASVLLLSVGVAWLGYVAVIGGDIFPAYRHIVPVILIMAFFLAEGTTLLIEKFNGKFFYLTTLMLLLGSSFIYTSNQINDEENHLAIEERWEWDGEVIGLMLKDGFGKTESLLAIEPAGVVPYYSELPSLDMLGLNDYYIAHNPPEHFGEGWIGHELGDPYYVLDQEPDLVIWCGPRGSIEPCFYAAQKMNEMPEFHNKYKLINFKGLYPKPVTSFIFVNRQSGKIGIKSTENTIEIPAYLFNENPETFTYLDQGNEFVIDIDVEQPAGITEVSIPAGEWVFTTDNPNELYLVLSTSESKKTLINNERLPVEIDLKSAKVVDIRLSTLKEHKSTIKKFTIELDH